MNAVIFADSSFGGTRFSLGQINDSAEYGRGHESVRRDGSQWWVSSHVSESMALYKASLHCHSVGHSVASLGRLGFHKKSALSTAM